jgi:hypothetical protein
MDTGQTKGPMTHEEGAALSGTLADCIKDSTLFAQLVAQAQKDYIRIKVSVDIIPGEDVGIDVTLFTRRTDG